MVLQDNAMTCTSQACEFGEDDGMARGPGLAGEAFVIGEQGVFADGLEFRIVFAAKTAAELQVRAGSVRHP